ncbi:MAG: hypothetical protein ACP5E3_16440, partial [Bacteroidales bacterium]
MKYILIFILTFSSIRVFGQEVSSEAGISPELNLSYKLNDRWKINSKIESFHNIYIPGDMDADDFGHYYEGTDIQLFLGYRLNPFFGAAMGYQHNIEPGEPNSNRA